MAVETLEQIGQSQRDRLFHIDFCALFLGLVRRADLMARFGVAQAAATRDLALYRSLAPQNLVFDGSEKLYRTAETFAALFPHDPEHSLHALACGIGDNAGVVSSTHLRNERPMRPSRPSLAVVAAVSRAIAERRAIRVAYVSLSSGRTERTISPHALVDTGLRWHVRAFDHRSEGFRDFVLTRILTAELAEPCPEAANRELDEQWMRIVPMELVPHPGLAYPEAVAADYGMTDGLLTVRLRAALVGYVTRAWGVDTSPDHNLSSLEYQLWLRNTGTLYGVESLGLGPGNE